MTVSERVPIAPLTTFRIGGPARYFVAAASAPDLCAAAAFARERHVPLFILGGGSNILVADEGFPGLVVKVEIPGIAYGDVPGGALVTAGAGVPWDGLVAETAGRGLRGLENLSGIPGTVGAAPIQNIGAYGVEVGSCIESVETLDLGTGEERAFPRSACAFGYRESFFKSVEGKRYAVTRVRFRLSRGGACDISYRDLAERFKDVPDEAVTPAAVREAVLSIRSGKLPDLKEVGTAGSFFKNPVISKEHFEQLVARYPSMPQYDACNERVKVPLAWILDRVLGLRGVREGNVGTHSVQPLVLVQYGNASARDVEHFAYGIAARVRDACDIDIEREVVRVPAMRAQTRHAGIQ